jgi:hypothetical protein
MKLMIVTRQQAVIEVENLPENFNFEQCCVQCRVQGFFQSPGLHVPYENISALSMGQSATIQPATGGKLQ